MFCYLARSISRWRCGDVEMWLLYRFESFEKKKYSRAGRSTVEEKQRLDLLLL